MCACVCACLSVHACVCKCAYGCVFVCVCVHACVCVYLCVCVGAHVCMLFFWGGEGEGDLHGDRHSFVYICSTVAVVYRYFSTCIVIHVFK